MVLCRNVNLMLLEYLIFKKSWVSILFCEMCWFSNVTKQLQGIEILCRLDFDPPNKTRAVSRMHPKLSLCKLWSMQIFPRFFTWEDSRVLEFLRLNSKAQRWGKENKHINCKVPRERRSQYFLSSLGIGQDKQDRPDRLVPLASDFGRSQILLMAKASVPQNHPKNQSRKRFLSSGERACPSYSRADLLQGARSRTDLGLHPGWEVSLTSLGLFLIHKTGINNMGLCWG